MSTPLGRLGAPVLTRVPPISFDELWVARGTHRRAVLRAWFNGFLFGATVAVILWWMFVNG
jgi:hypothetical protein